MRYLSIRSRHQKRTFSTEYVVVDIFRAAHTLLLALCCMELLPSSGVNVETYVLIPCISLLRTFHLKSIFLLIRFVFARLSFGMLVII